MAKTLVRYIRFARLCFEKRDRAKLLLVFYESSILSFALKNTGKKAKPLISFGKEGDGKDFSTLYPLRSFVF